jgi:hypothetical protein
MKWFNPGKSTHITDEESIVIATLHNAGHTRDEVRAHARLIIAAPDLLEALEGLCDGLQEHGLRGDSPLVSEELTALVASARLAIRKATVPLNVQHLYRDTYHTVEVWGALFDGVYELYATPDCGGLCLGKAATLSEARELARKIAGA